jgi:hypothetical protein
LREEKKVLGFTEAVDDRRALGERETDTGEDRSGTPRKRLVEILAS